MRFVAKVGVLLLLLLMAGGQVMACMLPSGVLTAEEKACCREMADQCGHDRMPPSHSCCKTITPPDERAVAKSSFDLNYQVQVLSLPQAIIQVAELPQHVLAVSAILSHSPPEAQPFSIDILRI
jgi:hypothetical protein